MRRFSQRNSLVTLSEINITPLLDLAFVLLIIFVITRPMLEGNVKMQLPQSAQGDAKNIDRHNVVIVEVQANGDYWLDGKRTSVGQLESDLIRRSGQNPGLIVDVRADKRAAWDRVWSIMDTCMRNNIKVSPRVTRTPSR